MGQSPAPDGSQLETRLLLIAEMLDRAVEEVHRVMTEIRRPEAAPDPPPPADSGGMERSDDGPARGR